MNRRIIRSSSSTSKRNCEHMLRSSSATAPSSPMFPVPSVIDGSSTAVGPLPGATARRLLRRYALRQPVCMVVLLLGPKSPTARSANRPMSGQTAPTQKGTKVTTKKWRRSAFVGVLALALAPLGAPAASASSSSGWRTVASKHASGEFAVVTVEGSAQHPKAIRVVVTVSRHQSASVYWDMTCVEGSGAGSKTGHAKIARTPGSLTLAMPAPPSQITYCTVGATASITGSGLVTATIEQR